MRRIASVYRSHRHPHPRQRTWGGVSVPPRRPRPGRRSSSPSSVRRGCWVRPWFATGDFTTVVGMSVTLPTGSSGANLDWHGGLRLRPVQA